MVKKIKVLFDANPLAKEKSGVGFYLEKEIKSLVANYPKELELTGYYFDFLGRGKKPPHIHGVTYKPIRLIPRALRAICWRLGFRLPLNLLIPSTPMFDVALFADFVSLPSFGVRRISIIHDLYFKEHPEYVSAANAKFLQRFVPKSINDSDLIITTTLFVKDRLIKLYKVPAEKIYIAPSGSNVDLMPSQNKKRDFLLYMGTIEPRKNLVNLLHAYESLPESLQKKYPLKLAGGKGWKDEQILSEMNRLQKKGLPVDYLGYISQEKKAELYNTAAALVFVSFYEGFGMQILEAAATRVPMILSDIPVFREVARESAFYCDPNSISSIASSMQKALEDDSSKKIKSYELIRKKYTWENSAKSTYEAILTVARKN